MVIELLKPIEARGSLERRTRLSNDWPLDSSIIQNLASSLSVSMDMY